MSPSPGSAMPAGRGYTVEPHGEGFAIYRGRDGEHHGLNLGSLTECSPVFAQLLERALNAMGELEARSVLGAIAPEMRYHAPPADRSDPAWKNWTLHDCPDGGRCRSAKGGGCARGWCVHYGVSPDPEGVPRFPAVPEASLANDTPPEDLGPGWIPLAQRMPTVADADSRGEIAWLCGGWQVLGPVARGAPTGATHWRPDRRLERSHSEASAAKELTLPGGWTLRRKDDEILVAGPKGGGWWKRGGSLQQRTLFDLANALLEGAAPPAAGWLLRFDDPDPQYEFELGPECPPGWVGKAVPLAMLAVPEHVGAGGRPSELLPESPALGAGGATP